MNDDPIGKPIEALELRSNGWLPAGAPNGDFLVKMAAPRMAEEAAHYAELAGVAGTVVKCPGCGGTVPFRTIATLRANGDELWTSKPCPICEYSEVVTIVPKRAVELRTRIEALQAVGVGPKNVNRYNSLTRQYRKVMAQFQRAAAWERKRANNSA